jgi:hypothetical protein
MPSNAASEPEVKLPLLFGVHESFVYKLLRQQRERGDIAPSPHGGGAVAKLNQDQLAILSGPFHKYSDMFFARSF